MFERKTIELKPSRGIVALDLHELWAYRDLVYFFLWRDVKGRYRQMALGRLWIILSPIFNMVLFTLIFGLIAKLPSDGVPYPVFNYTALLPWTFFANGVLVTASSLLTYRNLISKVYFPRLVLPAVTVLSGIIDFAASFIILLGMALFYGFTLSWSLLALPLFLLLAALTALAVGLWVASWAAHYRDVMTIMELVVRGWMYMTPVVYAISVIPEKWLFVYKLNPMTHVVEGFRWALLGTSSAPDTMLLLSFALVIPILITGAYYFKKTERTIVDIV